MTQINLVFKLFAGLLCLSLLACSGSKSTYPQTAEVTFVSSPNTGVVMVNAMGYGQTDKDAEQDAFVTAFNTILFKGLPAFGGLRKPMIDDESKARSEHATYFKKFFGDRGYLGYVTAQQPPVAAGKSDDKKNKRVQKSITINYESLRTNLEKEGVIRKFGF